jgi:hypothetical protein
MVHFQVPLPGLARDISTLTAEEKDFLNYFHHIHKYAVGHKRRAQKRERRIFDMLPKSEMIFNELIDWYLDLPSVTDLSSARRVRSALNNFREAFGEIETRYIKPLDLENYQIKRERQGASYAKEDGRPLSGAV